MILLPLRRLVGRFGPKPPGFWTEDGPNGWGELGVPRWLGRINGAFAVFQILYLFII